MYVTPPTLPVEIIYKATLFLVVLRANPSYIKNRYIGGAGQRDYLSPMHVEKIGSSEARPKYPWVKQNCG